jgi:hypothetical protein
MNVKFARLVPCVLCLAIYFSSTEDQAAVLDFERVNGEMPFEGMIISNQFAATFGMQFKSLDSSYYPIIVQKGHPGRVFTSTQGWDTPFANNTEDTGDYFLADAASGIESGPKGFAVQFDAPVSVFSLDLIDVDSGESVIVTAYGSEAASSAIVTNIFYATNSPPFGSGRVVPVSISAPTKSIRQVTVKATGGGGDGGNVAFDNFSSDYEVPPPAAAQLDYGMVFGMRVTGSLGRLYRIDYSEADGLWHPLSTNYLTEPGQWFFDKTQPLRVVRTYRAVGLQ